MGWPEYAYLAILCFGVGIICAKDGQPREDKYNGPLALFSAALILTLLWFGGFFS